MDVRLKRLLRDFTPYVEVIEANRCPGSTHCKIRCRYNEHEFIYLASSTNKPSDRRAVTNRVGDLKRIRRAIDEGNTSVMEKFKVRRIEE